MEETVLICEDSIEGILTGVYEAYALRKDHDRIHLQIGEADNYRLFTSYCEVQADEEKAVRCCARFTAVLERMPLRSFVRQWFLMTVQRRMLSIIRS